MSISKWSQGVNEYVKEFKEFLKENGLEPTEENLLNGASDWTAYSWGGSSLVHDESIAERLATPSEIKSRTRKDGSLNPWANKNEQWLDIQARALRQASYKLIKEVKG